MIDNIRSITIDIPIDDIDEFEEVIQDLLINYVEVCNIYVDDYSPQEREEAKLFIGHYHLIIEKIRKARLHYKLDS